jgi:hypothetical protein
MPDSEILKFAAEGGLVAEAEDALRAELDRRSISLKEVHDARRRLKQSELQIRVGNNPYYRGTGLRFREYKRLGKGAAVATRWIEFAYIPLIPVGSYRVVHPANEGQAVKVIDQEELQWDQVLNGWKRALLVLSGYLALMVMFVLWEKYKT